MGHWSLGEQVGGRLVAVFSVFSVAYLKVISTRRSGSFLPRIGGRSLAFDSRSGGFGLAFGNHVRTSKTVFFKRSCRPVNGNIKFEHIHLKTATTFNGELSNGVRVSLASNNFSLGSYFVGCTFPGKLCFETNGFGRDFNVTTVASSNSL